MSREMIQLPSQEKEWFNENKASIEEQIEVAIEEFYNTPKEEYEAGQSPPPPLTTNFFKRVIESLINKTGEDINVGNAVALNKEELFAIVKNVHKSYKQKNDLAGHTLDSFDSGNDASSEETDRRKKLAKKLFPDGAAPIEKSHPEYGEDNKDDDED